VIVPRLLEEGITQEQIDEIFLENPRRFFGPVDKMQV
jgi:predicted metal-dependent phosphotriesterase family hydrolase